MMRVDYAACPLCASGDIADDRTVDVSGHPLWRQPLPPKLTWRRCRACGHSFASGYFTPEALKILFAGVNESQMPGQGDPEAMRHRWAPTVERVTAALNWYRPWDPKDGPHLPTRSPRWLDVGFGDGALMATAQEWGYEVVGVDTRGEVVDAAKALGFDAFWDLDDPIERSPFDVVSMFDVLEHTDYPAETIALNTLPDEIYGGLRPGGLLVVSCPNMGCHAWERLDAKGENPYWGELEHYHNFSRARLVALLDECGFDFVSYAVSRRWRLGMEIIARKRS